MASNPSRSYQHHLHIIDHIKLLAITHYTTPNRRIYSSSEPSHAVDLAVAAAPHSAVRVHQGHLAVGVRVCVTTVPHLNVGVHAAVRVCVGKTVPGAVTVPCAGQILLYPP